MSFTSSQTRQSSAAPWPHGSKLPKKVKEPMSIEMLIGILIIILFLTSLVDWEQLSQQFSDFGQTTPSQKVQP